MINPNTHSPNTKSNDLSPKVIYNCILSTLKKSESRSDSTALSLREDSYLKLIDELKIERNQLLKSIQDYDKEIQSLRKQLDFYKIAANSQLESSNKPRDVIFVQDTHQTLQQDSSLAQQEAQSKYMQELIKDYNSNKLKIHEKLNSIKPSDTLSKSNHNELLQAFYEEKRLREELEFELSHKCDLIEELLVEIENKRRVIQRREYEYQELLALKDEDMLKMRYERRI